MEEAAAMEEEVAVGKRGRGEGSKAGRRYVRGNVGMEEEEEAEEVVVGSRGGKGAVPLSKECGPPRLSGIQRMKMRR